MQTGLQAAIKVFKDMHRKLFSDFHRKRYLNYCICRQAIPLIKAAKYALKNEMTGLYGYVSYTPQKDVFYVRSWDIRAAITQLEISPTSERICEIISRKTTNRKLRTKSDEKIIDELVKLYYEYALISFHYVYLNNLMR